MWRVFAESNLRAEWRDKYFCRMKFSTQVLISLWKSAAILMLTTRFSVACCCLHYLSATLPSHRVFKLPTTRFVQSWNMQGSIAAQIFPKEANIFQKVLR